MQQIRPGVRVHLVGIGGIGLSAIARVLHGRGHWVSGSDLRPSALTAALAAEGITVYAGHRRENLMGSDSASDRSDPVVIISSAVPEGNPEVVEARALGLTVLRRQDILGELTAASRTVAVAGTHGKTTTTAMIAWILTEAGMDPSFIVGGVLQNLATNGRAGTGKHFVIEADEYDRAFWGLHPDMAVVTTLEHDHPDCYPTFAEMRDAYASFAERVVSGGLLMACRDDEGARRLAHELEQRWGVEGSPRERRRVMTYGTVPDADWQAVNIELEGSPTFDVRRPDELLGRCALQLPGKHNVLNALAALVCSAELGVEFDTAAGALTRFRGTERRFEVKGQAAGVTIVDDYAHHPTEIEATLSAARTRFPGQTIWAVFQPHTYSRTAALLEGFAAAFGDADHVLVTRIYAARERNTLGVSGGDLVDRMISTGAGYRPGGSANNGTERRPDVQYVESLEGTVAKLTERVRSGDVIITLGAGDGYLVGERMLLKLKARHPGDPSGLDRSSSERPFGRWGATSPWPN
ncbi:UDP-N-acetylmuramate--L-alanine ligase [Chloroflexota bacterium]